MPFERQKKKRKLNPPHYDRSFGGSPDLYSHVEYTSYDAPSESGHDEPPTLVPPHFEPQRQTDTQIRAPPIASTSRLEKVLYNDVLHHVFSFLGIECLSSSMRVNQTFAKTAKKARANTKHLCVGPTANKRYVKAVLENCTQITSLKVDLGVTLPEKQLETIIRFYADTVVSVNMFRTSIVCSKSSHYGQAERPISCSDYFLSFLSKTVKNRENVQCYGCFRESDFLEFASTTRSLKILSFGLGNYRFHEQLDMDMIFRGLKLLLHNNRSLTSLQLLGFVGCENILLNADCPSLKDVHISSCTSEMLAKLTNKFPTVVAYQIQSDI